MKRIFFVLKVFISSPLVRRLGFALFLCGFIFGGAYIREKGFDAFTVPSNFLANIGSTLSSFFSHKGNIIAEIPLREDMASSTGPCVFTSPLHANLKEVRISEIAWMGSKENYNAEWIEIENQGDREEDISFFQLLEKNRKINITFPAGTFVSSHNFFLLSREVSGVKDKGVKGVGTYMGALNNQGVSLRLFNASCEMVDEVLSENGWSAGDNKTKKTMERAENGTWQNSAVSGGTPNAKNSREVTIPAGRQESEKLKDKGKNEIQPRSKEEIQFPKEIGFPEVPSNEIVIIYPPILISEVFVGGEGENNNEYIELFNPNTESFALSGWTIKKKSGTGSFSSLISVTRLEGKSIVPKGYFLVGNEEGYKGAVSLDASWAKSNTLAYSQNSIVLFNPKGEKVMEVIWNEIPKGRSFSLNSGGIFTVSEKTPKAENK